MHLIRTSWPLEAAGLQSFIQQNEAVSLPIESLDPVSAASAEQEQRASKGVQVKLSLHGTRQAIYATAQIGITASDVDGTVTAKVNQHDLTA